MSFSSLLISRHRYLHFSNASRAIIPLTGIFTLLLLPAILKPFFSDQELSTTSIIKQIGFAVLCFCTPVIFFCRNIKLYFYLLSGLIILTPFFIFALILFYVRPGFELAVFVLQTNASEVKELASGYLSIFLFINILYLLLYFYFVKKVSFRKVPFKFALPFSTISIVLALTLLYSEKYNHNLKKFDLLEQYYPASVGSGATEAYMFIRENNLEPSKHFSFNATKKDSLNKRQIYVFIIGESSRFDRWQINGYTKPTSPRLSKREQLISFPNVVSGCNLTWMSVPQMITRANPDDIKLQFREKSILSAFRDAGFKTAWLSNQPSDQEIFWSGTIGLHAKTADVSAFSPTRSPNFEFEDIFDGRLLPAVDSIINSDEKNLFIVLHTQGNHWDYFRRYPKEFDQQKPSGYTEPINPPDVNNRDAVSNSYDNSILYADYIIDSVINIVDKYQAVSYVGFLSDHGEDLFDTFKDRMLYHLHPSRETLHVPFFLWTSKNYLKAYPQKAASLQGNKYKKIGPENTFYTLLDLSNIGFNGFDTTKSISNQLFTESKQKYYNNMDKTAGTFSDLIR